MAKKERQRRSARKARAAERAEREAAVVENAVARGEDPDKAREALAKAAADKPAKADKDKKPSIPRRIVNWFRGVATEMRKVVWPTPRELRNYSFAVVGLLLAFGLVVWGVDTGIVAGLVQYARLRPDATPEPVVSVDTGEASAEEEPAEPEEASEEAEASDAEDADEEAAGDETEANADASTEDADASDGSAPAEAEDADTNSESEE